MTPEQQARGDSEVFNDDGCLIGILPPAAIAKLSAAGLIEQDRAPLSTWIVAPGRARDLRAAGLSLAREDCGHFP